MPHGVSLVGAASTAEPFRGKVTYVHRGPIPRHVRPPRPPELTPSEGNQSSAAAFAVVDGTTFVSQALCAWVPDLAVGTLLSGTRVFHREGRNDYKAIRVEAWKPSSGGPPAPAPRRSATSEGGGSTNLPPLPGGPQRVFPPHTQPAQAWLSAQASLSACPWLERADRPSDSDDELPPTTAAVALTGQLTCPLTGELLTDPVVAPDGRTYERAAVTRWIDEHRTAPGDPDGAATVGVAELRPDLATREKLVEYMAGLMPEMGMRERLRELWAASEQRAAARHGGGGGGSSGSGDHGAPMPSTSSSRSSRVSSSAGGSLPSARSLLGDGVPEPPRAGTAPLGAELLPTRDARAAARAAAGGGWRPPPAPRAGASVARASGPPPARASSSSSSSSSSSRARGAAWAAQWAAAAAEPSAAARPASGPPPPTAPSAGAGLFRRPQEQESGEEDLDCPICLEEYNLLSRQPRMLLCGGSHEMCAECVATLPVQKTVDGGGDGGGKDKDRWSCPQCRDVVPATANPNRSLVAALEMNMRIKKRATATAVELARKAHEAEEALAALNEQRAELTWKAELLDAQRAELNTAQEALRAAKTTNAALSVEGGKLKQDAVLLESAVAEAEAAKEAAEAATRQRSDARRLKESLRKQRRTSDGSSRQSSDGHHHAEGGAPSRLVARLLTRLLDRLLLLEPWLERLGGRAAAWLAWAWAGLASAARGRGWWRGGRGGVPRGSRGRKADSLEVALTVAVAVSILVYAGLLCHRWSTSVEQRISRLVDWRKGMREDGLRDGAWYLWLGWLRVTFPAHFGLDGMRQGLPTRLTTPARPPSVLRKPPVLPTTTSPASGAALLTASAMKQPRSSSMEEAAGGSRCARKQEAPVPRRPPTSFDDCFLEISGPADEAFKDAASSQLVNGWQRQTWDLKEAGRVSPPATRWHRGDRRGQKGQAVPVGPGNRSFGSIKMVGDAFLALQGAHGLSRFIGSLDAERGSLPADFWNASQRHGHRYRRVEDVLADLLTIRLRSKLDGSIVHLTRDGLEKELTTWQPWEAKKYWKESAYQTIFGDPAHTLSVLEVDVPTRIDRSASSPHSFLWEPGEPLVANVVVHHNTGTILINLGDSLEIKEQEDRLSSLLWAPFLNVEEWGANGAGPDDDAHGHGSCDEDSQASCGCARDLNPATSLSAFERLLSHGRTGDDIVVCGS